jgi:hypothetical protein
VDRDERKDQAGDEQDVHGVQAGDELRARELAVEEQERAPRSDDGDRLDDASRDLQAGAGQQVVGEGVAREAGAEAESDERDADDPVELTGLAEGSGEEHAEHVDRHRRDEEQRRPVVHLADE